MPAVKSPLALIPLILALSGCTMSGSGMQGMIDDSVTTGSIARTPALAHPAPEQDSDNQTVRNAVSAADINAVEVHPLAWANAETGTKGEITAITEVKSGPRICRTFKTSRQRFDGIALYKGEACTFGAGQWTLTRFAESE
ncbi:RT0821/Lpp0805 family surface protein [Consotaella salsifontis]|uniref:Outer membrane surface antigen n=1 Tax=Consotaella salsifontis TaxID=1365950 RepID=A0A1T4MY40_9HYPH|nr:RT0821/Lpp0805 family surface protein [Consotaella salsifontis]SJZ71764.1 outer membrane surface antigen [Consotaella salsifontis]